jgi:hypothetical protein
LITAANIGTTYLQITHIAYGSELNIIVKVHVHDSFKRSGGDIDFFTNHSRITAYSSAINDPTEITEEDDITYYIPSVMVGISKTLVCSLV